MLVSPAFAEDIVIDGGELEDITVVVGRAPDISWVDAPFTVTSLETENLQQRLVRNLTESLSQVPGVAIQKTANGHGSPFIRGFTGYRTLALIDGVRYNNSVYRDGPNEYFSLIDFGTIDRIELLHGPSSVVYGSDAIGGTLNLHTKKTSYDEFDGNYLTGDSTFRASSAENSIQGRLNIELGYGGEWGLKLGVSAKHFGDVDAADIGIQENTGYDEYAFDLRYDRRINDLWELSLVHQTLEQDDVWRTHSTIFGESFAGTTVGTDLRRLKDQHRTLTYAKLKGEELDYKFADDLELTFSYQSWNEDGERVRSTGIQEIEYFESGMAGIDLQLTKYLNNVDLVYGFDAYLDNVDSGRTDFNSDGTVNEEYVQGPIGDDSSYLQTGAYVQADWKVNDRVNIVGGSRFSYVRASVGSFEDPATGLARSFEDNWATLVNSARIKVALDGSQEINAWGGVSQSFRAPNIADLSRFGGSRSDEFEVAATDLDPEKFLTFETGLKIDKADYQLGATYYFTFIDDFITSTPTGRIVDGLTEVSKLNSSEGYVHGIEINGRYHLSDEWSVWANAAWVEGEIDVFSTVGSTVAVSEPISRIAPLTLNAGVEWKRSDAKYWAGVDIQCADKADKLSSGDIADTQRIPSGGTPGYTVVNVYGGYRYSDSLSFNLVLDNLFDEAYRVHGSGTNESGFGVNIGINASF